MRFKAMPGGSQEANVLRTYIETVLELPGKRRPGTTRISAMRKRSWRRTITVWKR